MYKIILNQKDYLNYLLFTASKSQRIRNNRIKSWLMLVGIFACMGVFFIFKENRFLAVYFFVAALAIFVFYPMYIKQRYIKHYRKYINENMKNRIGVECQIGFKDGCIVSKEHLAESKTDVSAIEHINEIADNIFIRIKTGETLIIPSRMNDFDKFKSELKHNISAVQPSWNVESKWKWR